MKYLTNKLSTNPSLKEIYAYKKKLTWGDVPTIYHLTSSSLAELDGILTQGFQSAYKQLFDKEHWNLDYLEAYQDSSGDIQVKNQPKIALRHYFDEQNYELKCYPVVEGKLIYHDLFNHPFCPFTQWHAQLMQRLFRIKSIVPFIDYTFNGGDEADMALVKYAHLRIEELISILTESFEVIDIKGYNLADFCLEIKHRKHNTSITDM